MIDNTTKESVEHQSESENGANESLVVENTISDHQDSDLSLKKSLYRFFGISVLVLSSIILPLTIISFFYHPGQQDETALLIEQIIGFILTIIGITLGSFLLLSAKKMDQKELIEIVTIATDDEMD